MPINMVRLLDKNQTVKGVLKNVLECTFREALNTEYSLDIELLYDEKAKTIGETDLLELDGQLFDIVSMKKSHGGFFEKLNIKLEHVSYRLNRKAYAKEYFAATGSPSGILQEILDGTPFRAGTTQFWDNMTFSIQEESSRRKMLLEFAATLKGELIFNNFEINLVTHIGSAEETRATIARHLKMVSAEATYDYETDTYVKTFECEPISNYTLKLGDEIRLINKELTINEKLRVISREYNPYNPYAMKIRTSTYKNSLEDSIYRIETDAVKQDALYNGCRIGPEFGFEVVRNDKKARAYFRSDEMVFQSGDGNGVWRNRLYYAYDAAKDETVLVYDGVFSADLIISISDIISPYIYTDNGAIVNAIVRRLRTDLSKPWRFLNQDPSEVHYQDIGDTDIKSGRYFKVDYAHPELPPVQFTVASVEGMGETPLWWYKGNIGGSMTTNSKYASPDGVIPPGPVPVIVYQYETVVVHSEELELTPQGYWGVKTQWGQGIDATQRGAGLLEKTDKYMQMTMKQGGGEEIGGIRVSVEEGVELYNPVKKKWEYPHGDGGGGGGTLADFERLVISADGFAVKLPGLDDPVVFTTVRDADGRIIEINDNNRNREVVYI